MKQQNLSRWLRQHDYGSSVLIQLQQNLRVLQNAQHYPRVLQLGLADINWLPDADIAAKLTVAECADEAADVVCQFSHLPLADDCMDLVIVPFVLSQCGEKAAATILCEAVRVLCGYGQLLIVDVNPYSLWRLKQKQFQLFTGCSLRAAPTPQQVTAQLNALSATPDGSRFVHYLPWRDTAAAAQKWQFLEAAGNRWWPHAAALYALSAVKQNVYLRPLPQANKRPVKSDDMVLNPISARK